MTKAFLLACISHVWLLLLAGLCLATLWYYAYTLYAAFQFRQKSHKNKTIYHQPPVTILKPLYGIDRDIYENLASFCQQDYPDYQIVFCVQRKDDPVLAVVQQVMRNFPDVDTHLVVNEVILGTNRKVSNLVHGEQLAKHALLVLADSDIKVEQQYLNRIVQPFRNPQVGVVTCLYRPQSEGSVADFEALGIATDYLAGVIVANELEDIQFALGPTVVVRREALQRIGGFVAIADYLADDFQLGYQIGQAGYKVVLSDYIIDHLITTDSWHDLVQRQVRWNLCTKASRPLSYLGLIVTQGTVMSLLFLMATLGSPLGWTVLMLTWSLRMIVGWVVSELILQQATLRRSLWLIPLRDLVGFGIWVYSLIANRMEWRGQHYRLQKDGKLERIPSMFMSVKQQPIPLD